MRLIKRQKTTASGERWFAEYSPVPKDSGQTVEDDAAFRFKLGRTWDIEKPPIMFIGLNPSTATHLNDDRTVARCVKDAKRWGFGGMFMMNLFPFRSTDPDGMYRAYGKPRGPWRIHPEKLAEVDTINATQIIDTGKHCDMIVCAWGNHGKFRERGEQYSWDIIDRYFSGKSYCYRYTKEGEPEHPLYQKHDCNVIPYSR